MPCAVCGAALPERCFPACPEGSAPSAHPPGPPCRIFASLSPPPAADRMQHDGSCPAARGPVHPCSPLCAPSSPCGCPETARCPRRAPRIRRKDLRPQNAVPPAHGPALPEWARLSHGRSWRSAFPGSLRPHSSKPQNRTPFPHPAPFPAGLPAGCLRPHHSIPAACGAFPAPAPLHEQGSSPLLHRALPQSGRSGPCGPFPARQAFRPAGPQAPLPHGHGIGLQCLPAVLPAAPSTAVRQTDAAHRWSAFFLRVSTASPPRPGAARINP